MDTVNKIVALTDEKNYLRNLLIVSNETGRDLEALIQDKIDMIYREIEKLEASK